MNSLNFIEQFPELSVASASKLAKAFETAVKKEARAMLTTGVLFGTEQTAIAECQTLLFTVALYLKLDVKDVKSRSRKRPLVDARKIYSYIVKNHVQDLNISDAGDLINRTHSAILGHAKEAVKLKGVDKDFASKLAKCLAAFENAKIK